MQSTRILSLLLFFLTFGLFVTASPVNSLSPANSLAKRCDTCSGGELDLIKILTDLKVDVQVSIDVDVKAQTCPHGGSPSKAVAEIIAKINAAVKVIGNVKITDSTSEGKTIIAQLCVDIIISICVWLSKCSLLLIVTLCLQLDVCLSAFINICVSVCGGLLVYITACLKANINLNLLVTLKLVLTLAACGLGL